MKKHITMSQTCKKNGKRGIWDRQDLKMKIKSMKSFSLPIYQRRLRSSSQLGTQEQMIPKRFHIVGGCRNFL